MGNQSRTSYGQMVFCVKCKTVVWALDEDYGDVRGICNRMKLPCPQPPCDGVGTFDGFSFDRDRIVALDVNNAWAAMHKVADEENLEWKASPDNVWRISGLNQ